jgi:hypothetical protein
MTPIPRDHCMLVYRCSFCREKLLYRRVDLIKLAQFTFVQMLDLRKVKRFSQNISCRLLWCLKLGARSVSRGLLKAHKVRSRSLIHTFLFVDERLVAI